ncbi:hypothetical protein [Streptomyces sp. NPDC002491]
MRDNTTREVEGLRPAPLRMPQQAPPVDRSTNRAAAVDGDGVQPSGLLNWLGQKADDVIGGILPF